MARKYPTTPMCSGEILERFEPTVRETDVFTSTIAKCGQTWLCALLHHLRTRGRDPEFGGRGLMGVVPWLEMPMDSSTYETYDVDQRLAFLQALPDPRVFKMHVVWEEIPRPPGSAAKVITITRDPRDVPWSMYSHLLRLKRGPFSEREPPSFEEWFPGWLERGFYFQFVEGFWPHRDDPDVLWLRYEDLIDDLAPQARRLVDFLGWDVDAADLARVLPLVSFDHMRRTEQSAVMPNSPFKAPFFRKGAVGANREHLSPEMERAIVDRVRSHFSEDCADFLLAQGG